MLVTHYISLISCYLNREGAVARVGDALREARMHQTTSISGLDYSCHHYQTFSDTPKMMLCFAHGGGVYGEKCTTGKPPLIRFYQTHKENKGDKRVREILINNSGFRAINRLYRVFRTLEGGVSWGGGELAASLQVTGYPSAVSCVLIGRLYIMEQDVFPGCTPPSIFSASRIILRKTSTAVWNFKKTRHGTLSQVSVTRSAAEEAASLHTHWRWR